MIDISQQPVKNLLDALDSVLNSNTFLLCYRPIFENPDAALKGFLCSDDFYHQILQQDIEREWHNMHYFDFETDSFKPRPGSLRKPDVELKINNPPVDKKAYLIATLIADRSVKPFYSPHNKNIARTEAEEIVDNFLACIVHDSNWKLYTVYPDFLQSRAELGEDLEEYISYFEDIRYASDSATLIITEEKHFLLLTNGIP